MPSNVLPPKQGPTTLADKLVAEVEINSAIILHLLHASSINLHTDDTNFGVDLRSVEDMEDLLKSRVVQLSVNIGPWGCQYLDREDGCMQDSQGPIDMLYTWQIVPEINLRVLNQDPRMVGHLCQYNKNVPTLNV